MTRLSKVTLLEDFKQSSEQHHSGCCTKQRQDWKHRGNIHQSRQNKMVTLTSSGKWEVIRLQIYSEQNFLIEVRNRQVKIFGLKYRTMVLIRNWSQRTIIICRELVGIRVKSLPSLLPGLWNILCLLLVSLFLDYTKLVIPTNQVHILKTWLAYISDLFQSIKLIYDHHKIWNILKYLKI